MSAIFHLDDPATDLFIGDCREVLPRLPDKADLIFADPPFGWGVDYGSWDDKMDSKKYLEFTFEWIDLATSLLTNRGSLWINIPDDWAAEIVVFCKEQGLQLVNWCVWHFRFGQCRDSNFIVSKTHALYFVNDKKNRIWNPDTILEPSDRASVYNDARTQQSSRPGMRVPLDVWYGENWGRVQGNNKERRPGHQNQLPEVYLERIIRACSDPNSLVIDPFAGSGTTSVVARALGRRSIGIEFDEKLAASAFERIKKGAVRV